MGKVILMLSIMSGLVLLFYFMGFIQDTASSTLLNLVLNPEGFQQSSLLTKIITGAALVVTLVSSLIRSGASQNDFYIFIPLVITILSFGWDFLIIYQQIASVGEVARVLAVLIFGPLMLTYVMAVSEWWRGTSS